jgi:hypothetical protein
MVPKIILSELLAKDHKVCLLQTENQTHIGLSRAPEINAFNRMLEVEPEGIVKNIILASGGIADKFEHVIGTRYVHLDNIEFSENALVYLHNPINLDHRLVLSVDELIQEQAKKEYSWIEGNTLDQIKTNLKDQTILSRDNDLELIARLRDYGRNNGVQLYLLGSATGRAGPRQLVIKKMVEQFPGSRQLYGNINLASISSEKSSEEVFEDVNQIISSVDQIISTHRKDKFVPFTGRTVPRMRYIYGTEKGLIRKEFDHLPGFMLELTHDSDSFQKIVRPDIFNNNWFYRLS